MRRNCAFYKKKMSLSSKRMIPSPQHRPCQTRLDEQSTTKDGRGTTDEPTSSDGSGTFATTEGREDSSLQRQHSHTIFESSGANRGGHPSRQAVHAEGNFPFTQFILQTPLPDRFKVLTFDKYDVTKNPDNHL